MQLSNDIHGTVESSVQLQLDVLQNIPATAWTVTPDGQLDFINQYFLDKTGLVLQSCTIPMNVWNKNGSDLPPFLCGLHPDHRERVRKIFWEGIRSGHGWTFEAPFFYKSDGRYHWHLDRAVPVFGANDEVLRFVGTCTDIDDLKRAEEKNKALLEISTALNGALYEPLGAHFHSSHSFSVFTDVCKTLRRTISLDWAELTVYEPQGNTFRVLVSFPGTDHTVSRPEQRIERKHTSLGLVFDTCASLLRSNLPQEQQYTDERQLTDRGMMSYATLPLLIRRRCTGTLSIASKTAHRYGPGEAGFLADVAERISLVLANLKAYEEIAFLKAKLEEENTYLQDEIRTAHNFKEILGNSLELVKLLDRVEAVAPTDANVLITGETGSGKELIARAIHSRSAREKRPLVKVNCGAIPAGLIESELFGHVKGAFTSASDRRIGRFELANGGTLFLDEVGDLPIEAQVKLLRVLQEQEFEPVGSSQTIKVDVRIIAATNRDIESAVQSGTFRSDLYYRLNVIPLRVPALRERRTDIPQLVTFFLNQSAKRWGKPMESVSQKTMDFLVNYKWPGNIRELQNIIERGVVLSNGPVFTLGADLQPVDISPDSAGQEEPLEQKPVTTLEDVQRQHILQVLDQTGWLMSGPNGAGAVLNVHPNTLRSLMKRLGIRRPAPHRFVTGLEKTGNLSASS